MEQQIGTITETSIIERWQWWRKALKQPDKIGSKELPVHPGEYQLGYYRTRYKKGPWEPVGIYPDQDGRVVGVRGETPVDDLENLFTWCCRNPVEYADYMHALETGRWPDEEEIAAAIGDNSGKADETVSYEDQIEAALARLAKYQTVEDDATSAKVLSLRNRLNELSRDADKARTEEKKPHLEAGKAVDRKWQPIVKKAKGGADQAKTMISAWETEKYRRQQLELQRAEEAHRTEQEAAQSTEGETAVMDAPAPVADPVSIKPTYGKAASVKVRTVVKDVTDWPKLAIYMSSHPEAQDVLRKLAQRAIDAGRTNVPGITTEQKADIR